MEYALGGGLSQHLHRRAQGRLTGVGSPNGFLNALDGVMNLGLYRAITQLALEAAAMARDGRRMYWNVWHIESQTLTIACMPVNKSVSEPRPRSGEATRNHFR